MTAEQERWFTRGLAALCLVLILSGLVPRLTVRRSRVGFEQPDVVAAVEGEVERPGSYALPWGARIGDLVEAAGGFTRWAERAMVNLADPLTTGEVVVVPHRQGPGGEDRVSLNTASAADLVGLPGIGPATAEKIVGGRPYGRVEDLLRVSGIGPATLERLLPLVRP